MKPTDNTKKRLIALSKKVGKDAKNELGPELKKIYFEQVCKDILASEGEEEAQSAALDILAARYLDKFGSSAQSFEVYIMRCTGTQVNQKKEQYISAYGCLQAEGSPKIVKIVAKGDHVTELPKWVGKSVKTSFGIMNRQGNSWTLWKAPENTDPYETGVFVPNEDELRELVNKAVPTIDIIKAEDYVKKVVIVKAEPVVTARPWKEGNGGVYNITDDSVDRNHLVQHGNFSAFMDESKSMNQGPGSKISLVGEISKSTKEPDKYPSMSVWLVIPGKRIIPMAPEAGGKKDTPTDDKKKEAPAPVGADDLDSL